ncbi:MAG: HEAT repeat domain-containing protein [Phycisphaerales bacterium]|nr:HEAT repeat domain-containing protein [Phycisphaerales bacterium]
MLRPIAILALMLSGCDTPARTESSPSMPDASLHWQAMDTLRRASTSEQPLIRANAIEMLEPEVEPLRDAVLRGLVDRNAGVRFVSAMALGTRRLCGSSELVRPLLDDPSQSVRAAAIFALVACGDDEVDQTPLSAMVLGMDRVTRANAALVLSEIGNPTASVLLREAMKRPLQVEDPEVIRASELSLAEALVRLGDRRQLETIRAAFFAPASQGELTALASQMAGRLSDRTLVPAMAALALATGPRQAGPELRLIAAEALARIDEKMALPALAIEFSGSEMPEVRMQVAAVLGLDRSPEGEQTLGRLLRDPHERVRVAAAGAILRRSQRLPAASKPQSPPLSD